MVGSLLHVMRYMPALGFMLLALGWGSMILVGHFPATQWAWQLTLASVWLLRDMFYLCENILPLTVPGYAGLFAGLAGLAFIAVRGNWLMVRFAASHAAALTFLFHLVSFESQTASSNAGLVPQLGLSLRPDAAMGSLAILLLVLAGTLTDHIDYLRKIRARSG